MRIAAASAGTLRGRLAGVAGAVVLLLLITAAAPPGASAEQASQPGSMAAGQLDAGRNHTCALLPGGSVRCWGSSAEGELGYGNTAAVGDDELPGSAGPVDLGAGRTATAISAGDFHTCALLDDSSVRCWGFGANGRLGSGEANIGDDETPGSVAPVSLGRPAKAISAGGAHTCAVLNDDSVRCWGYGLYGQLGYASDASIGDDELPSAVGPVVLGTGSGGTQRTAKAVSVGDFHTCALLDDSSVRCWGIATNGQLGYRDEKTVGVDDPPNRIGDDETPGSVGPVDLGPGRKATAISAGGAETCAVLDDAGASVRCWGFGGNGRLGYGNTNNVGFDQTPGSVGPVSLGAPATAISVGSGTVCAQLEGGAVRCWGFGGDGRLGYGNTTTIGDDELPASAGPVDLGGGRSAAAISLGARHACVRLDDGNVRCWGYGGNGRLGYCSEINIGDDEAPASAGPVNLGVPGLAATPCPPRPIIPARPRPATGVPARPAPRARSVDPQIAERRRARRWRGCLARAARHARAEGRRARRGSARERAGARRHLRRHLARARRTCLKRHGRTPGRVTRLRARARSDRRVVLSFRAPGSDGSRPPAARTYIVKQSLRPIRGARGFRRAQSLCKGSCRFPTITRVGGRITLDVTRLLPRTTYYYAVAARDNVSSRPGPRSKTVKVRTR